ncbi:MAG: ABC transporter permease [Candidatus Bathyarchaeia archaeon]
MSYIRFLLGKGLSLGVIAVVALLATVVIAGYGGAIDEILLREIERQARESVARDPSFRGLSQVAREEILADLIASRSIEVGLDRPFFERLPGFMLQAVRLDFGAAWFLTSDAGSRQVIDIIAERIPRTVLLFTTGTLFTLAVGIPLGMRMARKPLGFLDRSIVSLALVSNALPLWWTGMLMILVFSFTLRVFPPGGFVSVPPPNHPVLYAVDILFHMTLPLITIVLIGFGGFAYVTRNMVLRVFQEDYIVAERARGIPERTITYQHALRAASPPIATLIGFSLLGSLGGAIISEAVFNWPGIGRLFFDAISQQDVPLIVGLTYVSILLYVLLIFVLEIVYMILDPRVRVTPGKR